jgi:dTDP-4-amino-4,6-dideoxygalactose transaminase
VVLASPPVPPSTDTPPRIRLSEAFFDEDEAARLREALEGPVAGNGPFCAKVEARLEHLLGIEHVLLTSSCTHAMELALLALGVGAGDEVICPSFTFVSTANAVLRVGARPVFADIEDRTLGLDPDSVARQVGPRTRALIPVHYAGLAAEMEGLLDIAARHQLHVVEDAAHGLAARWRGRPLGTLGTAGCFSFHETKNLTCGEGGALALHDHELAKRAEVVREKGTNRSAFLRGEVDKYTWVAEGSSYILSDLLAAVLDAQLDKLPRIQAARAAVAARYRDALQPWAREHGVRLPPQDAERESNDHIFYLLFPEAALRDRCLKSMRGRGVLATFHYVPLHSSPYGLALGGAREPLPVTEAVADRLLRVPLHPRLDESDVERVIDAVLRSLA